METPESVVKVSTWAYSDRYYTRLYLSYRFFRILMSRKPYIHESSNGAAGGIVCQLATQDMRNASHAKDFDRHAGHE